MTGCFPSFGASPNKKSPAGGKRRHADDKIQPALNGDGRGSARDQGGAVRPLVSHMLGSHGKMNSDKAAALLGFQGGGLSPQSKAEWVLKECMEEEEEEDKEKEDESVRRDGGGGRRRRGERCTALEQLRGSPCYPACCVDAANRPALALRGVAPRWGESG
jgi:hypothetical protein